MIDRDAIRRALNAVNDPSAGIVCDRGRNAICDAKSWVDVETILAAAPELLAIAEAHEAARPALEHRRAWLESRGLPETWTGALDSWGWVLFAARGSQGIAGVGYGVVYPDGCSAAWIRWDRATPYEKAEALRIEREK